MTDCFRGVLTRWRAGDAFSLETEVSQVAFTGALLKGDATDGFAMALSGPRSGDLNGLWSASFRRRRLAAGGVSIIMACKQIGFSTHAPERFGVKSDVTT
jgi:hypothetical protein